MKRTRIIALVVGICVVMSVGLAVGAVDGGNRNIVVVLRGTADAMVRNVPDIDGDGQPDPAVCFDVNLVDLATGNVIGTATDCLSQVETINGVLTITDLAFPPTTPLDPIPIPVVFPSVATRLINTTFFHFPQGDLVQRGDVTVQQVLFPSTVATHFTGSIPEANNNILSGTKRFSNATGTVRLAGAVDMSQLGIGKLTLDCIFVISLD